MATAYSRSLVDKILPKIQQYEATTGRKVSKTMLDSLFRQELDVLGEQDYRSRALELQQSNIESERAFRERQLKTGGRAAAISGAADIASAGATGYLAYKYLSKPTHTAVPDAFATTGGFTGGEIGVGPAFTEAPSAVAPGAGAGGAQLAVEPAVTGAAGAASGAQAAAAVPAYDAASLAAYDLAMAEGAATGVGSTAGTGAAELTGVMPSLGPVGAGIAGSMLLGKSFDKILPGGGGVGRVVGGVAGGAAAGAAFTAWAGPGAAVGAVIGGIVGGVTSLVKEGTVICSELHRQGLVPDRLRRAASIYGARAGWDVYKGYLMLAEPIVAKMQQSRRYTKLVAFFAIPTMKEMAHRLGCNEKGTLIGKAVLAIGIPLCRRAYRRSMDGVCAFKEVAQ